MPAHSDLLNGVTDTSTSSSLSSPLPPAEQGQCHGEVKLLQRKKRVHFADSPDIGTTYAADEYDRTTITVERLTPADVSFILSLRAQMHQETMDLYRRRHFAERPEEAQRVAALLASRAAAFVAASVPQSVSVSRSVPQPIDIQPLASWQTSPSWQSPSPPPLTSCKPTLSFSPPRASWQTTPSFSWPSVHVKTTGRPVDQPCF